MLETVWGAVEDAEAHDAQQSGHESSAAAEIQMLCQCFQGGIAPHSMVGKYALCLGAPELLCHDWPHVLERGPQLPAAITYTCPLGTARCDTSSTEFSILYHENGYRTKSV